MIGSDVGLGRGGVGDEGGDGVNYLVPVCVHLGCCNLK